MGAAKRFGPRLHDSDGAGRMLQPKASIFQMAAVVRRGTGESWGARARSREQGIGNREQVQVEGCLEN